MKNAIDDYDYTSPTSFDDGYKKTAAQKRQENRDAKNFRNNPYRTEAEELRAKRRKYNQAYNRRNPKADPFDTRFGEEFFNEKRETRRFVRCGRRVEGCNYVADVETYVRLNRIAADRRFNNRFYDNRFFDDNLYYDDNRYYDRTIDRTLDYDFYDMRFYDDWLVDAVDLGDCKAICRSNFEGTEKQACKVECDELDVMLFWN